MPWRWTLCLLFYLALDLSNPFVGGAFRFEAEQSIEATRLGPEGRRADADRAPEATPPVRQTARPRPPVPVRRAGEATGIASAWLAGRRQAFAIRIDAASPSALDEH
jgi:hypothetical protein